MKFLLYLVSVVLVTSQCHAHSITKRSSGSDSGSASSASSVSSASSESSESSDSSASSTSAVSVPVVVPAMCPAVMTFFADPIADAAAVGAFIAASDALESFRDDALNQFLADIAAGDIDLDDVPGLVATLLASFITFLDETCSITLSDTALVHVTQYFTSMLPALHPCTAVTAFFTTGLASNTPADVATLITDSVVFQAFRDNDYDQFLADLADETITDPTVIADQVTILQTEFTGVLAQICNLDTLTQAETDLITSYFTEVIPLGAGLTAVNTFFTTGLPTDPEAIGELIEDNPVFATFREAGGAFATFVAGIDAGTIVAPETAIMALPLQQAFLAILADLGIVVASGSAAETLIATYFFDTILDP